MTKWKKILLTALPITVLLSFQAFAGQWKQDMNGRWYENDDGSWLTGGWQWVDGNGDGSAECYYFYDDGYVAKDVGYVDGFKVDENGAWIEDGKMQTKQLELPSETPQPPKDKETPAENLTEGELLYRKAVEKNNGLDQTDANVEVTIVESSGGVSLTLNANNRIAARGLQNGNLQYVSTGNIFMFGVTVPIREFYTDGYYYSESATKYKQPMSAEDALNETLAGEAHLLSADDLDEMGSIEVRQEGENQVLHIEMLIPELNDLGEYNTEEKVNAAYMDVTIDKEGYCIEQLVHLDMDEISLSDGSSSNLKVTIKMTLNNPGQPVNFDIPPTSGYEEIYSLY